jgi:DNA-binding CsgD family transcriptional regulator
MSSKKNISYTGLLNDVYCNCNSREIENLQVLQLLKQAEAIPQNLLPFKGCIQVIDYTQRRHLALSGPIENLAGYHAKDLTDHGLEFSIDKFHKEDFKIFNDVIFGKVTDFLRKTPQEDHGEYLFTYSYRSRKADGKWMQLYQQGSYITDPKTKLPLFAISMFTDISVLKKDSSMIFSIDKKKNDRGLMNFDNLFTNYYYPDPEEQNLTRREREIVGRLAKGFSSRQMAETLYLSENTVANHRKNILKKTNCKNSVELVRYAFDKGII